jgi:hypothetical protein
MTKTRVILPVLAAAAALPILAGCGGGSSSSEPAALAPPTSSIFIEATLRPTGSAKEDVEQLVSKVAAIADPGAKIVEEIEKSASDSGQPFDYEKEVEPWLGERAGMALDGFHEGNFTRYSVSLQSTDTAATEKFLEHQVESKGVPTKKGSYEGVDYVTETEDGTTFGVVGEYLVIGKDLQAFKEAVDAENGESLADVDRYTSIASTAPEGSLAEAYVDIGRLIKEEGNGVNPEAQKLLDALGLEVEEASALASLVPHPDQLELDVASDFGQAEPAAPASDLLGTMPAGSVIALASSEFGKSIGKAIDKINTEGIPGQVPPNQLKSALQRVGINLDRITGSLKDIAAFAQGSGKNSLSGAVVLTTDDAAEAASTVSSVGLLLRANHTPGVTAVTGKASGFSIRSENLGPKPLVVATAGKRIAIGYGLPATISGLTSESGPTLSGEQAYKEAVGALGGAQISGFIDGPAAVALAGSLIEGEDRAKFAEAKPYLSKIGYVAIGSQTEGELNVARLIVGLSK